jgi:DNA polymerase-3 subunit epsilon
VYAIVDIETTGGHAAANAITEIAIYVHDGTKITRHFKTLINPQKRIPLYITALTGISSAMVASAPLFEEVAGEIYEHLKDNIFVAHNVNFDHSFICYHLKRAGFDLKVKKLCTVRLSRRIFAGLPSYSLGNLCRCLSIQIENRHRADGDAKATVTLEKAVIDGLPEIPGVYYFHDQKGKVIYVGKAVNIKKRVTSHFTHTDSGTRRQNFLRLIYNITCKTCANELHALVLESTEIKRLWPKYNYSQKQPVQKFGLYSFEDNAGYMRLAIDKKKKNLQAIYNFNLLHEGLVLMKKMVDEFQLNYKLCYLDKTPLKESEDLQDAPADYNLKVKKALISLENQLPTFAIVDNGLGAEEKLCLLIERGSFWGMGYISDDVSDINDLKEKLVPHSDNDFIRNSIYSYVAQYPDRRVELC